MSDFYALLGVPRDAGEEAIKRAYRRQAMEWHPDRNNAPEAEAKFREITEAYEVLLDPERRQLYDRYGEAGLNTARSGFHHVNLAEALQIFMRDFGGLGGLGGFESLFGGAGAAAEAHRGQDIRVAVKLSLQDVATGAKRLIKLRTLLRCETCGGGGGAPGTRPSTCSTCGGSGEVRRAARSVFGQFVSVTACPNCNGEGVLITKPCEVCRGDGRIRGERSVSVDIPAGVSANNYITLRGQGAAGPRNAPPGDLLVMIEIKEDERFERVGDDLNYTLPLSYSQAALGTTLSVPTPYGDERLTVPPGIQSGSVLRIRGKGLPRLGGGGAGDLQVRVHVWTPENLSSEQRRLLEEFSRIEGPPPKQSSGFWSRLKEALGA